MTAPLQPASRSRSRRALLAGALGGVGAWAATAVARVRPTHAAIGDPLILGSTANSAGGDNTAMTTSSAGTALLVTQTGSGTALRGSAVGPGSIAGFFTAQNGTGISGVTGNSSNFGIFAQNNAAAGTGAALRAAGGNNHGVDASTNSDSAQAVRGSNTGKGAGVSGTSTFGTGVRGTGSNGVSGFRPGAPA